MAFKVIRVWTYMAPNKGFLPRILDYLSYALVAFIVGLFIRTDLIIATSPQLFTAVSARWLSFFKRKPWVMEVRDLWPESIKAVGAMSGEEKVYRFLERMVRGLYRSALGIVVVTNAFKNALIEKGVPVEKLKVVTNGVDDERFYPMPKNEGLLKKLNIQNKFIVGYIGTHGLAHKLDFILDCAAQVEDDRIHFLFIGSGAEKENLLKQSEALRLTNVTFLDPIPREQIHNYISITDVALVPLRKSATFRTVIPSKIFENAAMEKPILLGVEGESKMIIESYKAGLCFEPENGTDFKVKLHQLVNGRGKYESCQLGCRRLVNDYNRKELADRMLTFLEEMYTSARNPTKEEKPYVILKK